MRKGFGKLGLICMAVVIALSSTAVAYAQWSDSLTASGTVTVEGCWVQFTNAESNDSGETIDPGYNKNVGCTEVEKEACCMRLWRHRCCLPKKLVVTVTNGYPCYHSTVDYTIKAVSLCRQAELAGIKVNCEEVERGEEVDLGWGTVVVTPPETIPPCNSICYCNSDDGAITVHADQDAAQGETYKVVVDIYYIFTWP